MSPHELRDRLRGVLAFTPTPFSPDDRLDADGLAAHVDYLIHSGVHGVVVCGGVGEFFSLDADEYRAAIRTAADAAQRRVPVLAGVGHTTRTACRLAEYAASAGVAGLMIHPQYFVDAPDDGLVLHYRAVARAARLGMMIYSTQGSPVPPALVRRLAEIDEVVALKDEYGDVTEFRAIVGSLGSRLAWVNGMAEMHAGAYFAAGAQAFTSGIVNFAPQISLAVWRAGAAGHADELHDLIEHRVRPLAALREKRRGYSTAVVKAAMNLLGLPGGALRLPLVPLAAEDHEALRRLLVGLGLLRA
jgi:5-dehydro-4-deoxyglucarate dehydratase